MTPEQWKELADEGFGQYNANTGVFAPKGLTLYTSGIFNRTYHVNGSGCKAFSGSEPLLLATWSSLGFYGVTQSCPRCWGWVHANRHALALAKELQ